MDKKRKAGQYHVIAKRNGGPIDKVGSYYLPDDADAFNAACEIAASWYDDAAIVGFSLGVNEPIKCASGT